MSSSPTRQHISDAALSLFAQNGFNGISLRDIAVASGYRLGSIYHFFPEKQALYREVVTRSFEWITNRYIETLVEHKTPTHKVRGLVALFFELFRTGDPHIRIVDQVHYDVNSAELAELVRESFHRMHAVLDPIVEALDPVLKERYPAGWLGSYIFGTAFGVAKLHRQHEPLFDLTSLKRNALFFDGVIDFIFQGLQSAVAKAAPKALSPPIRPSPARRRALKRRG